MLKRVEIKEFRSCHGVVLDDLTPVTVLVGRNAVGKTNILRAIEWLAKTATCLSTDPWPSVSGQVAVESLIRDTVYGYSLQLDFFRPLPRPGRRRTNVYESLKCADKDGDARSVFERRDEQVELLPPQARVTIGKMAPCMPALASTLAADSPVVQAIQPFRQWVERMRYYALDASGDEGGIVRRETYDSWLTQYGACGNPGSSVLLRLLHLFLEDKDRFQEIADLLGPDGVGLVDDICVDELRKAPDDAAVHVYWVGFRPSLRTGASPRPFFFSDLSSGTQRVIRIIVSLVFDESAVMLLEHPEDGIHPGLLRKLIGVLQSYSDKTQVIVSTHSPAVLNAFDPGSVRLVTMEGGATKVRPLTAEELSAAANFLDDEGSFSEFLETVEEN